MPDATTLPAPLAGLSPHDWPGIARRMVEVVRGGEGWRAFVAALASMGDAGPATLAPTGEAGAAALAPLVGTGPAADAAAGNVGALPEHTPPSALPALRSLQADALALDPRLAADPLFTAGLARLLLDAAAAEAGRRMAPRRNPFPVRFDAALLAGGSGTRIGGGKAFVPLGGRPLAAWAGAAASRYAERLLVVARTLGDAEAVAAAVAPFVAAPVVPVADRAGLDGPVAALLGAADAADGLLLTAPVDVPFLPDWSAFALHPCAIAATDRAHPTVLLADAGRLRRLAPAGSLRATLAPLSPAEVPFPAAALLNVNTREDLAEAEHRLARR